MGDFETFQAVQQHVDNAENEYGVPRDLLLSVIHSESSFNPRARSKAGAMGLMQITPDVANKYGVTDPLDPEQNIRAGAAYLADLLEEFDGNQAKAVQAYHMGITGTKARNPGPKTRAYVKKTMENYVKPETIEAAYTPRKAKYRKRSLQEWSQITRDSE